LQLSFKELIGGIKKFSIMLQKEVTYLYHLNQVLAELKLSSDQANEYMRYNLFSLKQKEVRDIVETFNLPNNQV
jgi:hypothetical protein